MSDSALINALSGFWHRFFADLSDVDTLYRGVEVLAEQFYVDMMHEVLGSAIDDTFLARRENYRLWRIRDTDVAWDGAAWVVKTPIHWYAVQYLQDGILKVGTILETGRDFTVNYDNIRFVQDPRVALSTAATRKVTVPIGGFIRTSDTENVAPGDMVTLADGRSFKVLYTNSAGIGLVPEQRLTGALNETTWSIGGKGIEGRAGTAVPVYTDRVNEMAVWVMDGWVDDNLLYRSVGNLLGGEKASTEQYRTFIKGVSRVFLCGPSIKRIAEGLTAAAGLPLVAQNGERILAITANTVTTDRNTYVVPTTIPLRSDLDIGQTLQAFEALTDVVKVVDHTIEPRWWYGISIPKALMPWGSEVARQVTTELYENKIGAEYRGVIGDPSAVVGNPWRRNAAFDLMDRVLKYNMYAVKLDPRLDTTPGTIDALRQLALETKPAHAYAYIWPTQMLNDEVFVGDAEVEFTAGVTLNEPLSTSGTWRVGTGYVGAQVGSLGTVSTGGMPLVIGGGYPDQSQPGDQTVSDGALYIGTRTT